MRIFLLAAILTSLGGAQSLTDVPPIVQLVRKPGTGGASLKPYANSQAAINVRRVSARMTGNLLEDHV